MKKTFIAILMGLLVIGSGCSSKTKVNEVVITSSTITTTQPVDCSDLSKKAADNRSQYSNEEFEKILADVIKACVARQNR